MTYFLHGDVIKCCVLEFTIQSDILGEGGGALLFCSKYGF